MKVLKRPVQLSPELAEAKFAKTQPERRSVFAFAYFDPVDWDSKGSLASGKVSVHGTATLRHVEYYTYEPRGDKRKAFYFDLEERRKRPMGGWFTENSFYEGRPINAPVARVDVK